MKKTYKEVDMDLDHVRVCDCTVCTKRGALNHRVEESDIRVFTPLADVIQYKWYTLRATDYICPVCGILPFRHPNDRPELWTVNVRCLDWVDLDTIPRKHIHGSRL